MTDVVELARSLVRLDTSGSGEAVAARLCGSLLAEAGARVEIVEMGQGRAHLLAHVGDTRDAPLILSGHLDTVPPGDLPWSRLPLCGDVCDGMLHGRGSADMKGGVAALVVALERTLTKGLDGTGVLLVLSVAEETGCGGVRHLVSARTLPGGGPLLLAEPTALRAAHGHKGVWWFEASCQGRSAHGSRPDLGHSAIVPLARFVAALEDVGLPGSHPVMGRVTANVGTLRGGTQINLVPDSASAEVDVRLVPGVSAEDLRSRVQELAGPTVHVETILNLPAVYSDPGGPFAECALAALAAVTGEPATRPPLSYFTDASVLQQAVQPSEIVLLGPGEPDVAHTLDECCPVWQIEAAADVYERIIGSWCTESGGGRPAQ